MNNNINQSVLCVIPARSGSKRIKNKNLANLNGKSLVKHAYDIALESGIFSRIVVSTDIKRMADGCPWIKRPEEISGATADISDATADALKQCEEQDSCTYDYIVTLQPAIPVRTAKIIRRLYSRVKENNCLGGITGVEIVPWLWSQHNGKAKNDWYPKNYPRSQEFEGITNWQEVNSVQIASRNIVLNKKRWGIPLAIEIMPMYAVIDIDDQEDLERAQVTFPHIMKALESDGYSKGFVLNEINGIST